MEAWRAAYAETVLMLIEAANPEIGPTRGSVSETTFNPAARGVFSLVIISNHMEYLGL
jgi:hypothetical protein